MGEKLGNFAFEGWKRDRQGRAAGVDDNRPRRSQFPELPPHGFPEAALDLVAKDCASERTWGSEADTSSIGAKFE